jgi:hypothetical protein
MQTHDSIIITQFQVKTFFYRVGYGVSILTQSSTLCSSTPSSSKSPFVSISPIIDPSQANTSHTNEPPLKKRKKSYDKFSVFQDTWAT